MDSIQLTLPFPPEEEWRDIPGFEGHYQASDTGIIYSKRADKNLSAKPNSCGYLQVHINLHGNPQTLRVHRLVMAAFVGNPNGRDVNHKNGVKTDNRLSNLEYVTRKENIRHARDVLGKYRNPHGVKLNEDKVREIRNLHSSGVDRRELAQRYGVCSGCIGNVIRRKTWAFIE